MEVADGTAFVNFAQEGLYGGSMQEIFTIMQITRLLMNWDILKRQFLIDDKQKLSWDILEYLNPSKAALKW